MIIKDNRTAGNRKFSMLHCGDVFVDSQDNIYMKTATLVEETNKNCANAVCITDGMYAMFDFEEMVTFVKTTLIIDDYES